MSIGPKPKTASPPKLPHVSLIRLRVKVLVMESVLIFRLFIAHKGVDSSALGMYLRILWTARTKQMTGQRNRYLVLSWVLALNLSPFFWSSNTTVTNLALVSRLGSSCLMRFCFLDRKWMQPRRTLLVFPGTGVLTYSQALMAKKKALTIRLASWSLGSLSIALLVG